MKNTTACTMRRIHRMTNTRHMECMALLAGVGTVVGRMTANTSSAVWSNDLATRSVIVRDERAAIMDEAVLR
jgi:hypothetical protein